MAVTVASNLTGCASKSDANATNFGVAVERHLSEHGWLCLGTLEWPMDLCWGRKSVDKVVKWTGPIAMGEYKAALVEYTYRIVDMAPWAQRPDIQQAFDSVKEPLDGAGTKALTLRVQLTSEGWEAERSMFD